MGYNARNDEIRDNVTRMRREWEAQRDALATVRRFNAILSAKGYSWFWPRVNPPSKQSKSPAQSGASVQIQARRFTPLSRRVSFDVLHRVTKISSYKSSISHLPYRQTNPFVSEINLKRVRSGYLTNGFRRGI